MKGKEEMKEGEENTLKKRETNTMAKRNGNPPKFHILSIVSFFLNFSKSRYNLYYFVFFF